MKDILIDKKENKLTTQYNSVLISTHQQKSQVDISPNETLSTLCGKFHKEVSYRFVVIVVFCMLTFCNGLQWVTFAPIAKSFKEFYFLKTFHVDLFSMIYMFVYPFINFPSSYIIDNKSMRLGLSLAALLTILGAVLKIFINESIYYAYAGQLLSAIAQPFILNSPGKIASTWFRDERRVLATSICCLANTLGIIFGYILPTFFLDDNMKVQDFKKGISSYLIAEAILSTALCLPLILLIRSKPKIPPSISQSNYQSPPIWQCMKLMFSNKSFITLLVMFTCILTYLNVYGTIINEYFSRYGLLDSQTSYISAIANLIGILGSISVSILIDKFKNYRKTLLSLSILGMFSHLLMTILLEFYEKYALIILLILWTLCSFTIVPIFTCSMDFVVELTYPVGESISGGFIMMVNQITGILAVLFCDYLMDNLPQYRYLTNAFCLIFFIISSLSLLTLEEKLIRHKKDIEEENDEK